MKVYVINKADFGKIFTPEVYTDKTQAWRAFAIKVLQTAGDCLRKNFKEDIKYLKHPKTSLKDIQIVLYDKAFEITTGNPITHNYNNYLFYENDIQIYKDLTMFKIYLNSIQMDEIKVDGINPCYNLTHKQ